MSKGLGIKNEDIIEYRFFFIDIDVVGPREENGEKQSTNDDSEKLGGGEYVRC